MNVRSRDDRLTGTSVGVKLLAGIIGLCAFAIAGIGVVAVADPSAGQGTGMAVPIIAFLVGLGLGMLALAAGLWLGVSWAWTWGFILYGGSSFGGLAAGIRTADLPALAGGVVSGLIAAYLYRQREQFGIESADE
ncbi:hypothetical protein HALLA_19465 [Halostagnicola larsenii XH-48]|uniref:Integral membrane protein n=1 Tax=Halostagnicola larsenii XH-48 TaxID=797299 RepID=W0JTK3_9EURY|nr:hypothetical protein [Halostagnicola larsenii]AHG00642.1 hypothetical protein HALLA_19465 [Halostagnicola larsenii XH-48]